MINSRFSIYMSIVWVFLLIINNKNNFFAYFVVYVEQISYLCKQNTILWYKTY